MATDARVIPLRVPVVPDPPPSLLALLEAVRGLPDATVRRYVDRWFPEWLVADWGPSWNAAPQSDGHRLHALPCGSLAGPDHGGLTAGELPDLEELEAYAREREARLDAETMIARAVALAGPTTGEG